MSSTHPFSSALLVGLVGLAAFGCKDGGEEHKAAPAEVPLESESPSAKIFPAPLNTGVPSDPDGPSVSVAGTGGASGKKAPTVVLRTLPLVGPVEPEVMPELDAPGFQLDVQVPWPQTQTSADVRGEPVRITPLLTFHLLPESQRHSARIRVELAAGTLALPHGTEFVASSDAEGWLVVWPDHRSYRVVSASSLRTILEERRVDRMPLVPVEVTKLGVGRLLGRDTERMKIVSSVGTLILESALVPELGGAGALACAFFMALLRADPRPHCADGLVPVHARYQWASDQWLELGALRLVPRSEYRTTDFSLPPRLGIFKPGELPPLEGRSRLDPASRWPEAEATATWQVVNHHDVPLYFLFDGLPIAWLEPHVTEGIRVPPGEHRHAARDWLGQVVEAGGLASPVPPSEAAVLRPEGGTRPTVQYGTPPEPEIE